MLLGNASFIYFLNYLLRLYIYYFLKRMLSLVFLRGGRKGMPAHAWGTLTKWKGGIYKGLMGSFSHAVKGTFEYMDMSRTATANGAGFLVVAICSLILFDLLVLNQSAH